MTFSEVVVVLLLLLLVFGGVAMCAEHSGDTSVYHLPVVGRMGTAGTGPQTGVNTNGDAVVLLGSSAKYQFHVEWMGIVYAVDVPEHTYLNVQDGQHIPVGVKTGVLSKRWLLRYAGT